MLDPEEVKCPAKLSPAKRRPSDFASAFAETLANGGMLEPQFTCTTDAIADACPSLESDPLGSMPRPTGWPAAHAKWLFYGPSYMNQAFQAVVASASLETEIRSVEDVLEQYDVDDCPNAWSPGLRHASSHRKLDCNWAHASDKQCHGAPAASSTGARVTFANGAEFWGLGNAPTMQWEERADAMNALNELMSNTTFDLIFYMAPHGDYYYKEHCAAIEQHRPVEASKTVNPDAEDDNMCILRGPTSENPGAGSGPWKTSPSTVEQYLNCTRAKKSLQIMDSFAKKKGSHLVKVLPWQVNPEAAKGATTRYLSFPAAWKYPCTGADASGGAPGVAAGPCAGSEAKQGPELSAFREGHPCSVVCESGTGKCVLGASALMAIEMVERALGKPLLEDYQEFSDWEPRVASTCRCTSVGGVAASNTTLQRSRYRAAKDPASQGHAAKEPASQGWWHWPWESTPEPEHHPPAIHAPATHAPATHAPASHAPAERKKQAAGAPSLRG